MKHSFFTQHKLPLLSKNVLFKNIQRPDYQFKVLSPYLLERENDFQKHEYEKVQLENRLIQKRTLQEVRRCEQNPLYGFPQEPSYKSLSEYYLVNNNFKKDWVQFKFDNNFFYKFLWQTFLRLKKEILMQDNLKLNKKSKNRIIMTMSD
ncbi:hypothetical protein SS50377_21868 [Spironucleus salmonicida]|uniref:Uncharacterized protein n=1 Tax=Spironucleus salmonicida TaxID=348837 RepID=A0A9P8S0U8_9EUKA|nr:hypothetical protein SS50377_21868 [Spironucleus salmonicida]